PSLEEASTLSSLDGVIKESMRILPPVPLQIRVAQADAAIAGHPVPKGTRVMLNTFLVNRAPDLYPNGDSFQPERWRVTTPSAYECPVFSAGRHACRPGLWVRPHRRENRVSRDPVALSHSARARHTN